jgi:RHS repeat-associated protein
MKAFLGTVLAAVHVSFGSTPVLEFSANPTAGEIQRVRLFKEALVPVGGSPTAGENSALAAALQNYTKRSQSDDFSDLTGFLEKHPQSAWNAALLTSLGLEYYNTAYYSRALDAWTRAWALGQKAVNAEGKFLADRAVCELAGLYSRLGRMNELEALLKSVERRVFLGGATERISLAREALWMMQNQPGVSFRCGPLALQRILLSDQSLLTSAATNALMDIFNSASSQQGFSLRQVAELSKKIGLNYQMAFREKAGDFVVPSVVHWKVGHYAAMVQQDGDRYLLEDPTFGNTVWATRAALEAETSGYFMVRNGDLPRGWRGVNVKEGSQVWGKGVTSGNDPDVYTPSDLQTRNCGGPGIESVLGEVPLPGDPFGPFFGVRTGSAGGKGMAVSSVHLMLANLQVRDTPLGYKPPVGPPVMFTLRYNHRDYVQQPSMIASIFGSKWSHDWLAAIHDNPTTPRADVKYFAGGGGARTFTGFDTNTQTFALQQFDHTRLRRIGTNVFTSTYEMVFPNGSKQIFGLRTPAGDVFLTQVVDPAGNAVTLTWADPGSTSIRLVAITDAIGQVTTISYGTGEQRLLITRITDPFGRFATFDYTGYFFVCGIDPVSGIPITCPTYILSKVTDVHGLESRFEYAQDIMQRMITPYGTNRFTFGGGPSTNMTMRFVEVQYPDGSRERVEYNQSQYVGIANGEPNSTVPQGMGTFNSFLYARNTYYWDRIACATAYGDHSKAKIYHWLHTANLTTTAGILESLKEPLERRVWLDYEGQAGAYYAPGNTDRPRHVGRVLDDGTTQLYTFAYNRFGNLTNSVDPVGRRFSFIYDTNDIDMVEIRQSRAGNNDLIFKAVYNDQHNLLTSVDAAGETNVYTYNARGQLRTATNPRNETTTYTYDANGYLLTVDGPLPGTNDAILATYDAFGRVRTLTDESGYTLTYDYDALDRLTAVTHPDATFTQFTYERLDLVSVLDRAGRETGLEYDNVGQIRKVTDPLGRETLLSWCRCGSLKTLIDPMGRATEWQSDIQGRLTGKQYSDGTKVSYAYEGSTSRLRQMVDEKQQVTQYVYNRDNTLASIGYANSGTPMSPVIFIYDTNYARVLSKTDGAGTTLYSYNPITVTPTLGAGELASIDGPLANDTITVGYDELGRRVSTTINGVSSTISYDPLGRVAAETNALGGFGYEFDGASDRLLSRLLPNTQVEERSYAGNIHDRVLERITHRTGATPLSEFLYSHDVPAGRITTWSQQAGSQAPLVHTFGYDDVDQLVSTAVTNAGALVNSFAYTYDPVGNRLTEQVDATSQVATYNSLNQISTSTAAGAFRTNEWDAEDRLIAVTTANQRTEFAYDGFGRRVAIRQLINGSEVSHRRFVWLGSKIREERDATGALVKRYFPQGVTVESGPVTGTFYYTRDHLGSIRELTDSSGNVRARYAYDPYGRRTKLEGDVEADFGFAGMFWSPEVKLSLTLFRVYDPELGRWLSRDPLENAEVAQGPNLYAYVANDPVNLIDPLGLERDVVAEHIQFLHERYPRAVAERAVATYLRRQAADKLRQPQLVPPSNAAPVGGAGGDVVEAGGGMADIKVEKVESKITRKPRSYSNGMRHKARPLPPERRIPTPSSPGTGPSGAFGAILEAGMTMLTMANCDTVEGIFAIMRVRRGELSNKYENEMMKEVQKDLW